jgi:hypothetical protein
MHANLTAAPTPEWLTQLDPERIKDPSHPLPLEDVLTDSLYYPACRFDPVPIKYLGGLVHSFIYVDYGVTEAQLRDELRVRRFAGYSLIGSRSVPREELAPLDWTAPILPSKRDGMVGYQESMARAASPFGHWSVWQRKPSKDDAHGPERFSLLFVAGDGCATFLALYARLKIVPRVVTIIQPGHGFGGNWTNFEREDGFFARCVANAGGMPPFLLFGGWGGNEHYVRPCWSSYKREVLAVREDFYTPVGSEHTTARLWSTT